MNGDYSQRSTYERPEDREDQTSPATLNHLVTVCSGCYRPGNVEPVIGKTVITFAHPECR
jgi:hypothetical protein